MATTKKAVPAKASAPKPAATPAVETAAVKAKSNAAPAQRAKPEPKAEKPKKPKLVRDSFTIPKIEYVVLEQLKERAAKSGAPVKKSEVLRAGIKALGAMDDAALLAALAAVPSIKTGRPAKA